MRRREEPMEEQFSVTEEKIQNNYGEKKNHPKLSKQIKMKKNI